MSGAPIAPDVNPPAPGRSAPGRSAPAAGHAARAVLLRLGLLAVAAAALAPGLARAGLYSIRYDWRYFESMSEISRRAVLWWHQAPLWNPYSCGGEVGLANPQSLDAAPSFLLVLLFGVAVGFKLALVLYQFLALDGAFRLARRFGLSLQGALLAAFGYGLSGWLALHFSEGHVTFIGVTLYPYLLLCYDRSIDELEWAIPTGLVAAWILVLGGTFTPPMAAELLVLWAVLRARERRSLRPLLPLALAAVVSIGCAAIRMLPVLQFVHDHPRPPFMRAPDRLWPWQLVEDLVAWRELAPVAGRKYWGHEYAARLPWLLLPLWGAGLWLPWSKRARLSPPRRRAARDLFVLTIAGAVMAMGNFSPLAPWSLLQRLPVLRDLRVPSRHMILVTLGLAVLAGFAWDRLADWVVERRGEAWRRRVRRLGWAAIALVAADGAFFTAWQYRDVFRASRAIPATPPRFFHANGTWQDMREHLFAGHGSLGCDEEAPLQRAEALDPGDVPQERLLDPAAGEVVASEWSPNLRVVTVALRGSSVLLVNSNWNEHWHLDGERAPGGPRLTRVAGRLAVDLAALGPGRHTLVLRYAPRSFLVGAAVTAVSLPLVVVVFFAARRRRRRREHSG